MILAHCRLKDITGHQAGRKLLEKLWKKNVGGPMPEIAVAPGGKPYFVDCPVYFSVSHTPRHAFCAISRKEIGIDAEEMDRNVNPAIASKVLSEEEFLQFQQAEDPGLALLRFWVMKEASAKCTGEGLRGYPNHTDFRLDDPAIMEIDGCLVAIIEKTEEK